MNYGLAFDEKRGCKKIWIRKNIKKNKKYGLAFDKKTWVRKKKKKKEKRKKFRPLSESLKRFTMIVFQPELGYQTA